MNALEQKIRNFNEDHFDTLALDVFAFQYQNVEVYKRYCDFIGVNNPKSLEEIPFLPIEFFKSEKIIARGLEEQAVFKSSGTGGTRSTHFVAYISLYEHTFERIYREQLGNPEDQVILALLPNYLEQGNSSLVHMVDHLIKLTKANLSGFYLNNIEDIISQYKIAIASGKQVVIFGVSYALLDLADKKPDLSQARIIETGGMKGRRKELTKAELHQIFKDSFSCNNISSEYGMTELLSQGYSLQNGIFTPGITMKVLIREVNDPFSYISNGKTGGINIVDLANLYSCSFIETQDLGNIHENGFEIMGRFDHSEVRGCNLMIG